MPSTGNTSTFVFSEWGAYAPKILSIKPPPYTVEALDDTDLSTTVFKQMVPGDLQEIGAMQIVVRLPSDTAKRFANEVVAVMEAGIGMDIAPGTATISWPAGTAGDATDPTLVGSAFVIGFDPDELNNDDPGTVTIELQFDGKTGPTYAVGAV